MIMITNPKPNVVSLDVSDLVDRNDIISTRDAIETALGNHDQIALLVNLVGFSDATGEAIVEDIKSEFAFISELPRIEKIGVVTDKNWVATMFLAFASFPGLPSIDVFKPSDEQVALDWVSTSERKTIEATSKIKALKQQQPGVFAYEISGKVTEADIDRIASELEDVFEHNEHIDLLVKITDFQGFEISALFDDDLWAMKKHALAKVRRYAFVGAPSWIGSVAQAAAGLVSMEVKVFGLEDEQAAWNWLTQSKAA